MIWRSFWRLCAALIALLALSTPAFAGGWAVVTLDALPSEIQAGQAISLGFMVRQHGVTPVDTTKWGGDEMLPILMAKNTATGETLERNAHKDGPVGHYVVDVIFPASGSWDIEIIPPPFEGTKLGAFTVAAATVKSSANEATAGVQTQPAAVPALSDRPTRVWWITGLALVIALALTALVQRESLARLLAGRDRSPKEPQPVHGRVS
ncbi:MAG TPA: hypothetical protein VGD69_05305 [Herpetosiphonaceae bacterium]